MSRSPRRRDALFAAADLGGTWVRVAVSDGTRVWRARRRFTTGLPQVATVFHSLQRRAGVRGRAAVLVVAARGVWTPAERASTRRRLRALAHRVVAISDAEAAWHAALDDGAGVLVLAGTGSIALARDAGGRWSRAGGLGPLLGDDGSAFWLGREWLRRIGDDATARRLARRADGVARIAGLAPMVLARAARGDRVAAAVTRDGTRALAELAVRAAHPLRLGGRVRHGWAGAVMDEARYRAGVRRALARLGVRATWTPRRGDAVDAALALAARLARRGGAQPVTRARR